MPSTTVKKFYIYLALTSLPFFLIGCHSLPPPKHSKNICKIFEEYPKWYWATKKSRHKWGVPISVQMAIIYQESHYRAGAKPARRKLFDIIPWFRPSTASGYTQALDETWRLYIKSQGMLSGGRDDFSDAVDFIGWYANLAHHTVHISCRNARDLYLAYHEGIHGYHTRTYRHKKWLIRIADKVQHNATRYRMQLLHCESRLPREPWWHKIF